MMKINSYLLVGIIVLFSSILVYGAPTASAKITKTSKATATKEKKPQGPVVLHLGYLLGAQYYLNKVRENALGDLKVFDRLQNEIGVAWNEQNSASQKYVAPMPLSLKIKPVNKNKVSYEVYTRMSPAFCTKGELKSKLTPDKKMLLCLKKVEKLNKKAIAKARAAKKKTMPKSVFVADFCFYCKFVVSAARNPKTGKVVYSTFSLSKNSHDKRCTPKIKNTTDKKYKNDKNDKKDKKE